jgi:hypothetical protein
MRAGFGVNELCVEAAAAARLSYAAFERVTHAEFAADGLHVGGLVLIR